MHELFNCWLASLRRRFALNSWRNPWKLQCSDIKKKEKERNVVVIDIKSFFFYFFFEEWLMILMRGFGPLMMWVPCLPAPPVDRSGEVVVVVGGWVSDVVIARVDQTVPQVGVWGGGCGPRHQHWPHRDGRTTPGQQQEDDWNQEV